MANMVVPINRLHYSIQYLSDLSFSKLTFEAMIASIYGFDRCLQNETSLVLYDLGIDSQMFWRKIIIFIVICIVLKLFTVLLLIFKINYNLKDNRNKTEEELPINLTKIGL